MLGSFACLEQTILFEVMTMLLGDGHRSKRGVAGRVAEVVVRLKEESRVDP
jgi:hypothetical protein